MQPAPSTSLAPPSIPAMRQLSEKPRQGFETRKTARKPGPSSCNFKVTLGLRATVVGNGVRETYSARYYNPVTGRFMSRDPEDGKPIDPKTLHKYLYAGGDPVNGWDPTGREETETALIFIRAGAAIVMFAECMEFFDVFMEETGKELSETPEEYTHASRKLAINELKCLGSWALLFGSFL